MLFINKRKINLNRRKNKLIKYIKKYYCEYNGEIPFIAINKLLLENYLDYYSSKDNYKNEEELSKVISQISQCLSLFKALENDDYAQFADDFAEGHTDAEKHIIWDSHENFMLWMDLVKDSSDKYKEDLIKAFKLIGKNSKNWGD